MGLGYRVGEATVRVVGAERSIHGVRAMALRCPQPGPAAWQAELASTAATHTREQCGRPHPDRAEGARH